MKWQKSFNVLLLLALLLAALTAAPPTLAQSTEVPSKDSVKEVMARVNDYWLANAPYPGDNQWKRAVYFTGDMAHYQTVGAQKYLAAAVDWAQTNNWQIYQDPHFIDEWAQVHNWQVQDCITHYADNHTAAQTYVELAQLQAPGATLACARSAIEAGMTWAWVEIDLGTVQTINQVRLYPFAERAYRYYIQVKTDPTGPYQTVVRRPANTESAPVLIDTFAPVSARYVKLWVVGAHNYIGWLGEYPPIAWVSIKEMEILDSMGVNLALNQAVTCSNAPQAENPCTRTVDGIRDNDENRWAASLYAAFKEESPNWWWIDALYMAMPAYAKLGVATGDPTYFEVMYTRYSDTKANRALYDPAESLWYRDETYIFDPNDPTDPYDPDPFAPVKHTPLGQKNFWARGNGWVIAALARTLAVLPESDPHYSEYRTMFLAMAAKLKTLQQPDGFWYQSLLEPTYYGGIETSGTAFFTYALAWGINQGLLPRELYLETVQKAWQGLVTLAVQPNGSLGYVQTVGQRPMPPPTATDTADYGVGAFLLAGSEVYKLAGDVPVAQNLARNKPVVCSSVPEPENPCANVVNGNLSDRWSATPYPQWVEVDLGAIYVIDTVKVHPFENRAYRYVVEGKATATGGYVTLVDRTANTQGGSVLEDRLAGVATRYVRLRVVSASGYEGVWVSIRELELFGQATTPVNALLSVRLQNLAYSPQPAPNAPAGVFTIGATFKNRSTTPLKHLFFQVTTLTGNNLLLNADGGAGGVGAILSVPGELAPQATATANFQIGLQRRLPFLFFVKAYGVLPAGVTSAELDAAAADLDLSISATTLDETTPDGFANHIYLPLVTQ